MKTRELALRLVDFGRGLEPCLVDVESGEPLGSQTDIAVEQELAGLLEVTVRFVVRPERVATVKVTGPMAVDAAALAGAIDKARTDPE